MQAEQSRRIVVLSAKNSDQDLSETLSVLSQEGFSVHDLSVAEFLSSKESQNAEVLLLPLQADSESALTRLVAIRNHPPIIIVGTTQQLDLTGELLQKGADEYVLIDQVSGEASFFSQVIERTIEAHRTKRRLQHKSETLQTRLEAMQEDHLAAFDVQQKLLPESQAFGDIAFGYRLVPRAGMSGDSVNCFELNDGRLLFYLADVAGHGVLGGVIATALTFTAQRMASTEFDAMNQSSADLLAWFNRALLELELERHVAMFLGVISADGCQLQYSSAAHFPGTILCQEDHCLYLELGGLPLGVCETEYETREVNLSEIFELVLFSDGVLEILPQDSLKNRENHLISLVESGSRSVSAISHQLSLEGLTEVPDDIAVLTIRRDKMTEDIKTA